MNPYWAEAYCFECKELCLIVEILGRRHTRADWMVAVRLACGHERHRQDRVVMTVANLEALQLLLEGAGALTVNT